MISGGEDGVARPLRDPHVAVGGVLAGGGDEEGGVLLVHASFRATGPVEGGPRGLIGALRDALGRLGRDRHGDEVAGRLGLGHRPVVGVDAAEGDHPAARGSGGLQDGVVGGAVPPGLVHGKHHAASVHAREGGEELLGRLPEAVRVVGADVRVGVVEGQLSNVGDEAVVVGAQDGVDVDHGRGRL